MNIDSDLLIRYIQKLEKLSIEEWEKSESFAMEIADEHCGAAEAYDKVVKELRALITGLENLEKVWT